ncbi:unnamed protein product [Bemisia tabaci]|uniref:Mitochondrial cardiolipin hydrolase n=1 Tax=Bemisia tabaci TaxID=7038 RepID=A0A9N9ZZD7_BEMTA|nr:PREDICTED: mitochondrial cardiolipin hydrolase-like [Bemisia tabaci]CAH0380935.1 unnamed protein product [Bemisia tabaci]
MLTQLSRTLCKLIVSENLLSFILFSYLISKACDHAPVFYSTLSKRLKSTNHRLTSKGTAKYFGRFKLPLAKCMFFQDKRSSCLQHPEDFCQDRSCLKKNLRDLFDLIRAARSEILLCCYTFSYRELANVIMEACDRNVKVRVVANFDSAVKEDSSILNFHHKGIRIRMKQSTYILHHKFIIIDGKILINGSTNFTEKGILGNTDSLLITSDPFFIKEYTDEFNYLWSTFPLTL